MSLEQNYSDPGAGRNRWLILVGVAVVCIAAIIWAYFKVVGPTNTNPASISSSTPTVASTVTMLAGRGKIAFPASVGASTSTSAKLPLDVQTVFKPSLNVMTVSSLTYRDKRTGFVASFVLASTLQDFYTQVVRGFGVAGWTQLYAARASSAAIYQAQSKTYEIQVLFTPIDQDHIRVDIQLIGR